MIKSCRRYWSGEIADSIVQLKDIRFDNPMFSLSTTFDRQDFTRLLVERFHVPAANVEAVLRRRPEHELLRRSGDHHRAAFRAVLSRPRGRRPAADGADHLCQRLDARRPGPELRHRVLELHVEGRLHLPGRHRPADRADGAGIEAKRRRCPNPMRRREDPRRRERVRSNLPNGRRASRIRPARRRSRHVKPAVVSNANLLGTIFNLVGPEHWDRDFLEQARAVRLNNSSTQVYMALKPEMPIEPSQCGDLLFSSTAPQFRTDLLLSRDVTSRTFSFYYPQTRPGLSRCVAVASTNANYDDWAGLSKEDYAAGKRALDRRHARGDGEVRARRPQPARLRRGRHALDVRALHKAPQRGQFRHEVRGPGRQPGLAPADRRTVSCRQRRHHHVGLAGRGQLRRDRGQRRGCVSDEGREVRD